MRAAVLPGVDARFELRDVPDSSVGSDQALVRVRAAGINFLDVLIRRGRYPQMPELPAVLGVELAGELEDGTRVMAMVPAGAYAELVAVPHGSLVPLPDEATFAEGAGFILTFLTAYVPLTRQVRLGDGATVLVHAAAGGVGTATIQVARALGARVVAAAGSPEKLELCRELGAESAYVYDELPDDLRVDVVVDPVGGELFEAAVGRLRPLGQLVAIGYAGGLWPELQPAQLVGRNVGVQGVYIGRLLRHAPDVVAAATHELLELWSARRIRPVVGAEFPLAEVEDAHALVESRRSVGKVVLLPGRRS
jgi:NADPH2:quinone reductase